MEKTACGGGMKQKVFVEIRHYHAIRAGRLGKSKREIVPLAGDRGFFE